MENPYKSDSNDLNVITPYIKNLKSENLKGFLRPAIELEKSKRNNLLLNESNINNEIDTNIKNYSVEDIFDLLNINIQENSEYETVKDDINSKITAYNDFFEESKNYKMIEFFKEIRSSLFGNIDIDKNTSEAEKLLILYSNDFDAEKNRGFKTNSTDTSDKELYKSNKGAGNPINRKTITKLLNIDSRFRKNYDLTIPTDYTIDLPYSINNVIEMKLSDLEFPTTYYPFNESFENNYFWMKITSGNNAHTYVYIHIPEGNYYHATLIETINNAFQDNGLALEIKFDLDYNNPGGIGNGNGHVTISVGTDSNVTAIGNIELNFYGSKLSDDVENYQQSQVFYESYHSDIIDRFYNSRSNISYRQRIGWMMGYRHDFYTGSASHTSEGILDVLGSKYLFLVLDDFNSSSNVSFLSSSEKSLLKDNIIARISLKGYAFSIQSQTDLSIYSEPRFYYGPVDINRLRVLVVDEYGRTVDINNMDFSFTLILTTIYSKT